MLVVGLSKPFATYSAASGYKQQFAQASCHVGPGINEEYLPEVDSASLLEVGLANGDDHASVSRLLNQYLDDHGAPATVQLHICQGLNEALNTLGALVTAHMLLTKG